MHPTGMSVERCVEALTALDGDLDRIYLHSISSASDQRERIRELVRDLTLDVDLRRNDAPANVMTDVEAKIYLPAIESILGLLAPNAANMHLATLSDVDLAREIARGALQQATLCAA